jgi:hypothetical protein
MVLDPPLAARLGDRAQCAPQARLWTQHRTALGAPRSPQAAPRAVHRPEGRSRPEGRPGAVGVPVSPCGVAGGEPLPPWRSWIAPTAIVLVPWARLLHRQRPFPQRRAIELGNRHAGLDGVRHLDKGKPA